MWSTVHHYVAVENPGGIQLLLMSSQKVNDEVLKNVGTPHLSCMPHAEVVSVCTGRLKNRRGRDGRSGGLGGGIEPCSCKMSNTNCREATTECWRTALEESLISSFLHCLHQELMRD